MRLSFSFVDANGCWSTWRHFLAAGKWQHFVAEPAKKCCQSHKLTQRGRSTVVPSIVEGLLYSAAYPWSSLPGVGLEGRLGM